MNSTWDTRWLKQLQQSADEIPGNDLAEEFPWYASAWLGKAMLGVEKEKAYPYLQQYISNPLLLHWLLQRQAVTDGDALSSPSAEEMAADTEATAETPELNTDSEDTADQLLEDVAERAAAWLTEEKVPDTVSAVEESPAADENSSSGGNAPDEFAVTEVETEAVGEPTPALSISGRLGSALQSAAAELKKDAAVEDEGLLKFLPHHTIDYFESIGIKLTDGAGKDKLQTQVKSFTQWLKGMKRINYETGNVEEDAAVTRKALASLQVDLVKTETMAEVLIKQGLVKEAAVIFTELQLLYPDKSAYFAARLEKLKAN